MSLERVQIKKNKILVVEGKHDEHFFEALLIRLNLRNDIQIIPLNGKHRIRKKTEALVKLPNFANVTSLGIVRDANNDPLAAFQSVCDALRQANLPVPNQPLIPKEGHPKVVVMIVPGPNQPGTLEDVCLRAVQNDPAMSCVNNFFQCISNTGSPLPRHFSKAKVQVFLASKDDPDGPTPHVGIAAKRGYWQFNDRAFNEINKFLRSI